MFLSTLRTCGIFCFVYICGPHTVRRSQPHKLVFSITEPIFTVNGSLQVQMTDIYVADTWKNLWTYSSLAWIWWKIWLDHGLLFLCKLHCICIHCVKQLTQFEYFSYRILSLFELLSLEIISIANGRFVVVSWYINFDYKSFWHCAALHKHLRM